MNIGGIWRHNRSGYCINITPPSSSPSFLGIILIKSGWIWRHCGGDNCINVTLLPFLRINLTGHDQPKTCACYEFCNCILFSPSFFLCPNNFDRSQHVHCMLWWVFKSGPVSNNLSLHHVPSESWEACRTKTCAYNIHGLDTEAIPTQLNQGLMGKNCWDEYQSPPTAV